MCLHVLLPSILLPLFAWFGSIDVTELVSGMSNREPETKHQMILLSVQSIASLVAFILAPIAFLKIVDKRPLVHFVGRPEHHLAPYVLIVGLMPTFMVVDAVFIEWNLGLQFPEPFHSYARQMEDQMAIATDFLTHFQSPGYFIFVFVGVAVLPAIGEELLFRGFVQRYFSGIFKNNHAAIWVTAILFSAFHFQFFGFVPRMLLGAFFGYIVHFSGNLSYAIVAHFINNGLTLIMLYLYQQGLMDMDIENTESVPLQTAGIFFIIGAILFKVFVRQFQNQRDSQHG